MLITDVCRLCLTKDNLVWIFDKRFESSENMKDVIYITTGVEIHIKDVISQKICKKCCQVTIKMFEFRRTSLKNDKHLRDECRKYLKDNNLKIPNTDVIIKSDVKRKIDEVKNEPKLEANKPLYKIHPSVRDLFRVYPQIKLPTVCLSSHITPFVSMPMDDVENYFKVRKLDFNLYTKLALKPNSKKVATKKTSAQAKFKSWSTPSNSSTIKIVANKSENKDSEIGTLKFKVSANNSVSKTNDKASISKNTDIAYQSKTQVDGKNTVKNIDIIDLFKPKSSRDISIDKTPPNRKRKVSETEEKKQKETAKKPTLIESLGLTPKPHVPPLTATTESPSLSYVANMSVPLHICDICNSVQYSAKELRRHQNKHLRCQFCKIKFRTFDTKRNHIENTCLIKNTMNNLPDVQLDKIEYNVEIRRKYPETFTDFPPLKNMCGDADNSFNIKKKEVVARKDTNPSNANSVTNNLKVHKKPSVTKDAVEIIEIMSDDEDSPTTNIKLSKVVDKVITNRLGGISVTDRDVSPATPTPATPIPTTPNTSNTPTIPPVSNTFAPVLENVVYNTVSIVKPDIKIKNSNILESIDPKLTDVKILKELLTKFKPLQLSAEKTTQTEFPKNQSISINRSELTSELKNLKQQLHVYKIPIVIKNGTYKVTYNYDTEAKQPKKLSLWNDLKPIDIKIDNLTVATSANERQVMSEKSNSQVTNNSFLPSNSQAANNSFLPSNSQVTNTSFLPSNSQVTNNSFLPSNSQVTNTSFLPSSRNSQVPNNSFLPSNSQVTNNSFLPSNSQGNSFLPSTTATYNFPGIQSLPPKTTGSTTRFVCVNTNSINSTLNSYGPPTTSIIDMNPLLNNFLQPEITSTITASTVTASAVTASAVTASAVTASGVTTSAVTTSTITTSTVAQAVASAPISSISHIETPISNATVPLGIIRVKNVWELT